jgi:hypothetical protein
MVGNLNDQVGIYRRLLDLTRAQVAAVQRSDVKSFHALLSEIEIVMLERSGVERGRDALITLLASELMVPRERVTASLLRERLGGNIGDAIDSAASELRHLVDALELAVAQSRALVEHELKVIGMLVKGVTATDELPTYSKYGKQADTTPRKLLDLQL